MKKYKVEFVQKEKFIVDVLAKDKETAMKLAEGKWNAGDYQETGDVKVIADTVYDVTGTDDPFNP